MQYEQDTDKVTMMNSPDTVASPVLLLAEDPEIKRTRKILLIILGVLLVSSCFFFREEKISTVSFKLIKIK